jgi:anti-sigma regulatory factor (Ser/Thr protein kinase)
MRQRQRSYRSVVPRSPSGAREARLQVKRYAQQWLAAEDLADFEMALGEALANAVEHGGGSTITVSCAVQKGKFVAIVEDRGPGFVWQGLPPAPRDGAIRGYGLFVMHALTDEIDILDDGRKVRLAKRTRVATIGTVPTEGDLVS